MTALWPVAVVVCAALAWDCFRRWVATKPLPIAPTHPSAEMQERVRRIEEELGKMRVAMHVGGRR